ncbi:glycosyltransferase [Undibacterium jejuense]|uniref:Glycosyltransferase n=1 Tax=Undibacterium jejuense TaxID=1344949 RepID=A0A923KQ07_9BURK|nr:glycosyltransferase [Undibacterium jejuense]MBC3862316.1 glycosyltransferase [Undibacterium jejuense]
MIDISICICTFRRPLLLQRLLTAVFAQNYNQECLEVIVVDNDVHRSAIPVLNEFKKQFHDRLTVLELGESNISLARNAAIGVARGEWVVMVDDDECPAQDWLHYLLATQASFNADVVFAPVLPEYAEGVPPWIIKGQFFDRRRPVSGTPIDDKDARSGNVLVRKSFLDQLRTSSGAGPFDPSFGKTGGEDSMLFRQLHARGACMVWCDEAPVTEIVPVDRATASWLLQRSFRTGQLFMRTELAMFPKNQRWHRGLWLGLRAIIQLCISFVLAIVLLPLSPLKGFSWARICASQFGKLNHFLGAHLHVYGD